MNRFPTITDIQQSKCASKNPHLFEQSPIPQKRTKFGNRAVVIDGLRFDSKREGRRYVELRMLKIAGEINNLKVHTVFQLSICKYISDFDYYTKDGVYVVEDSKGFMTKDYILKKKMMLAELKIEIKEV